MTSRRRFTERQVLTVLLRQGAQVKCPRCSEPLMLGQQIEREHFQELALGGLDVVENCFYSHAECHRLVTNGTRWTSAGSSKHRIAKAKRMQRRATEPKKLTPLARKYAWAKKIKEERARDEREARDR